MITRVSKDLEAGSRVTVEGGNRQETEENHENFSLDRRYFGYYIRVPANYTS
jgi:hypothetical protein